MPDTAKSLAIEACLLRNGYSFEVVDISHATSFRFECGAIMNVFTTGTISWQGKRTHTVRAVDVLIADLNVDVKPPRRLRAIAPEARGRRAAPIRNNVSAQSYGAFLGFGDGEWGRDRG